MIDIAKREAQLESLARRTRNNIPSGWWKCIPRDEINALLATGRWVKVPVTGWMKFPGVKPVTVVETFLRRVK